MAAKKILTEAQRKRKHESQARYYARNKDRINAEANARYHGSGRAGHAAAQAKYKSSEKYKATVKKHYAENKEKLNAYVRAWRKNNERYKMLDRKRNQKPEAKQKKKLANQGLIGSQ